MQRLEIQKANKKEMKSMNNKHSSIWVGSVQRIMKLKKKIYFAVNSSLVGSYGFQFFF